MSARIYKPTKTAMQSGEARMNDWILEIDPSAARSIDPLMGWTSSNDTSSQVRLQFPDKEAAIGYCERNGLGYTISEPTPRKPSRKSYADNFKFGRRVAWTH
jgi:ETC complex I subunit conserved region